jgi:hypothetical protein
VIDFTSTGAVRVAGNRTQQLVRLRLEGLEDRCTPAFFHVTIPGDQSAVNPAVSASIGDQDGNVTLRSAIEAANAQPGEDTILFALTDPPDPEAPSWVVA